MDHDKVQLWKDGPYWATTNIGADRPEDAGLYFMWGDTVGYKLVDGIWTSQDGAVLDVGFCERNCRTAGKGIYELFTDGVVGADGLLLPLHDAACANWGAEWRMPSVLEFAMLSCMCDWTWYCLNGVRGYKVQGKGGFAKNNIFLPGAGYGGGTSLSRSGSDGYYRSSVPYSDGYYARGLYFGSDGHYASSGSRYDGRSVRPVQGLSK